METKKEIAIEQLVREDANLENKIDFDQNISTQEDEKKGKELINVDSKKVLDNVDSNKELSNVDLKKEFTDEDARIIGTKLGTKWDRFNVDQFRKGINFEVELGKKNADTDASRNDPMIPGKIAFTHLIEFPNYYDNLNQMVENRTLKDVL